MITFSKEDIRRNIKIPKESEKLAEFLGILCGDGHLHDKGKVYKFDITLDLKEDFRYKDYVLSLINDLFNVKPRVIEREKYNTTVITVNSKSITKFLISMDFPKGNKKGKLKIPDWIYKKEIYIRRFIRGLADTDGSIFFAKRGTYKLNKYPVIEIKCSDEEFIQNVYKNLNNIGFKSIESHRHGEHKIQLNGIKNLEKWMREIKFKNIKHLTKYSIWKEFGYCQPNTKIIDRIETLIRRGGRTVMRPISR